MSMRHIRILFSAVVLILILSACQLPFKKQRPLPPEMILASACGQDKLKCCTDEPKCSFGQKCCPEPNGGSRNYCSDECGCGALDEFCCAAEAKCQTGLICGDGFCVKCGLAGGPCCETGVACLAVAGRAENLVECRTGQCVACGVDGEPACRGKEKCAKNHLLNNGVCYRCGGSNQPCCRNEQNEQSCNSGTGLVCELGFCK